MTSIPPRETVYLFWRDHRLGQIRLDAVVIGAVDDDDTLPGQVGAGADGALEFVIGATHIRTDPAVLGEFSAVISDHTGGLYRAGGHDRFVQKGDLDLSIHGGPGQVGGDGQPRRKSHIRGHGAVQGGCIGIGHLGVGASEFTGRKFVVGAALYVFALLEESGGAEVEFAGHRTEQHRGRCGHQGHQQKRKHENELFHSFLPFVFGK